MTGTIASNSRQAQQGAWIQIEDNGASIATAGFQQLSTAAKTQLDLADLEGCEFIELLITGVTLSGAPGAGKKIDVHVRELNLQDVANDTGVPDANYSKYRESFALDNATTIAAIHIPFVAVEQCDNEIYLENSSGVTLNTGYKVYARPRTIGPRA